MPEILDDDVCQRIRGLMAEGDGLAEAGRYDEAIARYQDGWALSHGGNGTWG